MAAGPEAERTTPEDFEISRLFAAPRPLVFAMWTEPAHFGRWFGPRGAITEGCTLDPRPGGVIAFQHRHGGAAVLHVKGIFDEVVSPERLVFTAAFVDAGGQPCAPPMLPGWPPEARLETSVRLLEQDGGTRVIVRQRLIPPGLVRVAAVRNERREAMARWNEVLDRLAEHLGGR